MLKSYKLEIRSGARTEIKKLKKEKILGYSHELLVYLLTNLYAILPKIIYFAIYIWFHST